MMWPDIKRIIDKNRGKVVGAVIGLLISIFYISFGFLRATFIIISVGIGYFIGKRIDDDKDFIQTVKKLLGPRDF